MSDYPTPLGSDPDETAKGERELTQRKTTLFDVSRSLEWTGVEVAQYATAIYSLEEAGETDLRDELAAAALLHITDGLASYIEALRASPDTYAEGRELIVTAYARIAHNLKKIAGLVRHNGPLGDAATRFVAVADELIGSLHHAKEEYESLGEKEKVRSITKLIEQGANNDEERNKDLTEHYSQRKAELLEAYDQFLLAIAPHRSDTPTLATVKQRVDALLESLDPDFRDTVLKQERAERKAKLLPAKAGLEAMARDADIHSVLSLMESLDKYGLRKEIMEVFTVHLIEKLTPELDKLRQTTGASEEDHRVLDKVCENIADVLKKIADPMGLRGRRATRFVAVADEVVGNFRLARESYLKTSEYGKAKDLVDMIERYEDEPTEKYRKAKSKYLIEHYAERKTALLLAYDEMVAAIGKLQEKLPIPTLEEMRANVDKELEKLG